MLEFYEAYSNYRDPDGSETSSFFAQNRSGDYGLVKGEVRRSGAGFQQDAAAHHARKANREVLAGGGRAAAPQRWGNWRPPRAEAQSRPPNATNGVGERQNHAPLRCGEGQGLADGRVDRPCCSKRLPKTSLSSRRSFYRFFPHGDFNRSPSKKPEDPSLTEAIRDLRGRNGDRQRLFRN